jgi:hypothetical protein
MFNNKDHVTTDNPRLDGKVFTIQIIPNENKFRLYQISDQVLFSEEGICIQTNYHQSLFRIGDKLVFHSSYTQPSKKIKKTNYA